MNKIKKFIKRMYSKVLYGGKGYVCPVCEIKLRTFLPLSSKYCKKLNIFGKDYFINNMETLNVNNYLCPNCGALDRQRLVVLYLEKYFLNKKDNEKTKILFCAPSGPLMFYLKKKYKGTVVTVDKYRKNVEYNLDLTDLSVFQEKEFDLVICFHVLEHIKDDIKAMKELKKVLKVDAVALFLVPLFNGLDNTFEDESITEEQDRLKYFGQEDHMRVYGKKDFLTTVLKAGFTVEEFNKSRFKDKNFLETGLSETSTLYVAKKE